MDFLDNAKDIFWDDDVDVEIFNEIGAAGEDLFGSYSGKDKKPSPAFLTLNSGLSSFASACWAFPSSKVMFLASSPLAAAFWALSL